MSDPLHGVTLKALLGVLVERLGWEELGRRVPIRCFTNEPSLNSSLKFLRKTPWARTKVEQLYVELTRHEVRRRKQNARRAAKRVDSTGGVDKPVDPSTAEDPS